MNRKGQQKNIWAIVVIVLAVLFLFQPQISNMLGGEGADVDDGEDVEEVVTCPVEDTTVGFSAVDVDDPGTTIGVNALLWIDGEPKGTVNVTSETTASPGDSVKILFGYGSSTYYGSFLNGVEEVPCKGTKSFSGSLWTKDTGVSMTLFDENFNQLLPASNNLSMSPGSEESVTLRIKGTHEEYYGNPDVDMDNLLAVEYNPQEIAELIVMKNGVELETANVPLVEQVASGQREIGFAIDKVADSSKVDYDVTLRADSTDEPDAGDTIVFKMYDADWYYNSDSASIESGLEDHNHDDIGVTSEPSVTLYLE